MHLHKFFQYCQLVQAGVKEVPGELVKYLKVNSACQWALIVFFCIISKYPEPCCAGTRTWAVLGSVVQDLYLCLLTRPSAVCVLLPAAFPRR